MRTYHSSDCRVLLSCIGLRLAEPPFISLQQCENSRTLLLLRKVTWRTMSRGLDGLRGLSMLSRSSNWIGGLLLPTEDGVSELSQIVYRVIKSLHTNTCQLRSALTKTVHLIPPTVHLQPTRNGQLNHAINAVERSRLFLSPWCFGKLQIEVIKTLTQLAVCCWPCLQVVLPYPRPSAIPAVVFSYLISSSACRCKYWKAPFPGLPLLVAAAPASKTTSVSVWKEWVKSRWTNGCGGGPIRGVLSQRVFHTLQAVFYLCQVSALSL